MKVIRILVCLAVILVILAGLHYAFRAIESYHTKDMVAPVPNVSSYMHSGDQVPKIVFRSGDVVYMHYESLRATDCNAQISYRLITEEITPENYLHRTVYDNFGFSQSSVPAGHYVLDIRYVIPSYLTKGDYIIERYAAYTCDGFKIDKSPRSTFTIE